MKLYDAHRKKVIVARPEERVRMAIVHHLTQKLGFPKHLLTLEKQISSFLPPGESANVPERRIDILCYSNGFPEKGELVPLLMIECKAGPLTKKGIEQIIGYHYFIKSLFIGLANEERSLTGWFDEEEKKYQFVEGLFSYETLVTKRPLHNSGFF